VSDRETSSNMGRTKKAPPSAIPGILSLLGFVLFVSLPTLVKIGANDVTLKVGGPESATVIYKVGDPQEVGLGSTELPWELKPDVGLFDRSVDVFAFTQGPDRSTWCEIWIGDELCDREDDGDRCRCRFGLLFWSGTPNGQRSQRTSVR
jgi:hypothetical protein